MALSCRFLFSAFASSSVIALVLACGASGTTELSVETEEAGVEPLPTSILPPSSPPDAAPPVEAGKDASKDASKDAAKESGTDAGKSTPNPGDPCTKIDEIFSRSCGACGTQEALCLGKPDGGSDGIVTAYSRCENELAGGCIPGTVEDEACGNCGTHKRTCTQFCEWSGSACTGEPLNSCVPTAHDYTAAGCLTIGTVRTRACSDACSWTNFTATCSALEYQLPVAGAPGGTVSAIYPLRSTLVAKRLTGTCTTGSLSTTTDHPYAYVELVNPTGSTLTLSAWNTAAPGGPILDTLMAWYAGNTRPADDAARKTCAKGMVDSCPSALPCGDAKWAGLTATNAITLPPFGSAIVFFGTYYAASSSSVTEGDVKLVVRTDTVK
jgi:hypothetical protein